MSESVPAYDAAQSAFHRAFRPDLYRILDGLPLPAGGSALDVPCGNGFYTRRLAERVGRSGRVTAVDLSEAYLAQTRERLADLPEPATADVRTADAYALPFPDAAFDLVWSAQSLISLDPLPAVREMFRVAKPDGTVAILEGDEYHHLLLPWPVELEAALPAAVLAASHEKYGDGTKLAPARRLRAVLKEAGFRSIRRRTYSADRAAPFDPATTEFLTEHLAQLRELVYPKLTARLRKQFDAVTDPDGKRSFFRRPDAELTCINAVFLASARSPRQHHPTNGRVAR